MTTQLSLSEMLQEPIPSVLERERTALDRLLLNSNGRVVLFGSGSLGQRAAQALRTIGVSPLAFSDNNRQRWHTEVEGLTILPPEEAARRYGRDALFLVTIWNEFH
jgi:threonine dehydrogenase-like Zn-dependent dehydrogenase